MATALSGSRLTPALLNDLAPNWTTYTPVLTATTTNPVLNNGTATGRYLQWGKTCIYTGIITMGSTTTYGSGAYLLSAPIALLTTDAVGMIWLNDVSASASARMGVLAGASGTNFAPLTTSGNVTPTNPWTWAVGDAMRWWIMYETV